MKKNYSVSSEIGLTMTVMILWSGHGFATEKKCGFEGCEWMGLG
jgi:hypothetical protein